MALSAQEQTPTIYGTVINSNSGKVLEGATVLLLPENAPAQITDSNGQFAFENVRPGRYSLQIDFLGFQSQRQVELLVEAGRSVELNIKLVPTALDLPEAMVRAGLEDVQSQLLPGVQILTIEETRRLPATFNDPARQLLSYPGVANANDQANHISVRGNSPSTLAWRIEGVEIVNPNHLSNAGTRSDAITESGGGVNMLSSQMLSTSSFYAGAIPAQYGNFQGGLMDMKLRSGNREKWESTLQLGLLGLDASFEGPFSKNKKSSYLFNYRYSTLGLFEALGVQISEESIKFQDAALHLNFPTEKMGRFTFFGLFGNSRNLFEAERDSSAWEIQRDRIDVSYKSRMWMTGLTHQISVGKNGSWNTTAVFSEAWNQKIAWLLDDLYQKDEISRIRTINNKLSFASKLNFQLNNKVNFKAGLEYMRSYYALSSTDIAFDLWRPFTNFNIQLSSKLNLDLGLSYVFRKSENLEENEISPRVNINYNLTDNQNIILSYNRSIRLQPSFLYLTPNFEGLNNFLSSVLGNNFAIAHHTNIKNNARLKTEIYFQQLDNAATLTDPLSQFSSLNIEELVFPPFGLLTNEGKGRTYGLEILWQKYIQKDFYYIINTSLFNSQYKNFDQDWRDTRYNSQYISNATIGKEFRWEKKGGSVAGGKSKTLGFNIRLTYLGNLRYTPIDLEASIDSNFEILNRENTFGNQLNPYFKGDLRIYLRTDKVKYSNSLSLDIQNFTSRQNDGYFFYDPLTQAILEKKQLGLIPILNWRLSF